MRTLPPSSTERNAPARVSSVVFARSRRTADNYNLAGQDIGGNIEQKSGGAEAPLPIVMIHVVGSRLRVPWNSSKYFGWARRTQLAHRPSCRKVRIPAAVKPIDEDHSREKSSGMGKKRGNLHNLVHPHRQEKAGNKAPYGENQRLLQNHPEQSSRRNTPSPSRWQIPNTGVRKRRYTKSDKQSPLPTMRPITREARNMNPIGRFGSSSPVSRSNQPHLVSAVTSIRAVHRRELGAYGFGIGTRPELDRSPGRQSQR